MDSAGASKRRRLAEYLATRRPDRIGDAEWGEIGCALAPVSDSRLRELLRRTGIPVDQPWAGVRQRNFAELEQSLVEMAAEYARSKEAGLTDRARACRRVVIAAKDHARLAVRNPRNSPATRAQKAEMVEWMLVWLGDPAMFRGRVEIRKEQQKKEGG
jgi:hypothetical protein